MGDGQQLTRILNDPKTVAKMAIVDENEIQLYGRRWLILAIFMAYTIAAGLHWMQYSIIANLVVKYYNVEAYEVEWTPMIHMLAYVMFILPALWFLEKFGNRVSMIVASGGVCMGAWIKMFAARPDAWFFVICGQIVEATGQVFTFGLAGSVTATWFGHHEIALAGSLASFGDLFGAGIGFVFPTLFVNDEQSTEEIGRGIYEMCLVMTVYMTAVFAVVLIFFQDHPKKLPSNAQIVRNEQKKQADPVGDFIKTIKKKSLLLILLTYGIHISIFYTHGTLLNRTFMYYFPNNVKDAGRVGCLIILSGMIGSLFGGYFLNRTHLFKETTYVLYICSTVCLIAYTMAYHFENLTLVYVFACMLGIFMFGYYATTLQLAYEVVHPYSEGMAAGLAICSVQLMGVLLTPLYRETFERFSPLVANFSLVGLQIIGILLTFRIPAKYRRQQAEKLLKHGESEMLLKYGESEKLLTYGESAKEFIKEIENDTD